MPSLLKKQNVIWKLSVTVYAAALFAISSSAWSTSFTIADGETEKVIEDFRNHAEEVHGIDYSVEAVKQILIRKQK